MACRSGLRASSMELIGCSSCPKGLSSRKLHDSDGRRDLLSRPAALEIASRVEDGTRNASRAIDDHIEVGSCSRSTIRPPAPWTCPKRDPRHCGAPRAAPAHAWRYADQYVRTWRVLRANALPEEDERDRARDALNYIAVGTRPARRGNRCRFSRRAAVASACAMSRVRPWESTDADRLCRWRPESIPLDGFRRPSCTWLKAWGTGCPGPLVVDHRRHRRHRQRRRHRRGDRHPPVIAFRSRLLK